jgi:hypothetical protein
MKRILALVLAWALIFGHFSLSANADFGDLPPSHKYYRAIESLKGMNIIRGYTDNTVRPDRFINRAEFMKLLVEGLQMTLDDGSACFTDIEGSEWFAIYICTGKSKGIVSGLPDGSFQPGRNINKAETMKIIVNTLNLPKAETFSQYSDVPKEAWFHDFIATGEAGNILEEKEVNYDPAENYSRGQISEILYRVLSNLTNNRTVYTGSETPSGLEERERQMIKWQLFALDHINQLRKENGKEAIKLNTELTEIAGIHSQDMGINIKEMSHDGSLGELAHERVKQGKVPLIPGSGFTTVSFPKKITWSGENVGMRNIHNFGGSIEDAIVSQHLWFMDEPVDETNHRTTMLSSLFPFTEVGIGLHLDETGNLWITEDYISIQN